MTIFSVAVPSSPRCRIWSHRHSCRSRARDADRVEGLDVLQRLLDFDDRPVAHGGDLFDRGDEVAVVVEVADDRAADLLQLLVAGLQRELPHQVIRERRRGRQRVLDRRQLLDFLRRARAVAVVEVVAEEVLVVGVVPGVGLVGGRLLGGLLGLLLFGRLELLGRDFFEERVLDHLLVQEIGQLQRGHRQELDRLLERRREDELLNEFGVQLLRDRHWSSRPFVPSILVQSEVSAEVNPLHFFVIRKALRRSAPEDHPVVDDVGAVGDAQRLADVVVGDQHADAARLEVEDDLLDVGDGDRVDARERLVEQHELRRDDQRAGDLDPAPLAARQGVGGRLGQRRQAQLGEQLAQPGRGGPPRRGRSSRGSREMFCSTVRPRKIEASCGR